MNSNITIEELDDDEEEEKKVHVDIDDGQLVRNNTVEMILSKRFETIEDKKNGYTFGMNHIQRGGVFQCDVEQFVKIPVKTVYKSFGNAIIEELKSVQILINSFENNKNQCQYANLINIEASAIGTASNGSSMLQILVENGQVFLRVKYSKKSAKKDKIFFYGGLTVLTTGAIGAGYHFYKQQQRMEMQINDNREGFQKVRYTQC